MSAFLFAYNDFYDGGMEGTCIDEIIDDIVRFSSVRLFYS